MDPVKMARRVLGMAEDAPLKADDGVDAGYLRPCVACGALTDLVAFDDETCLVVPPLCERCEQAMWDVAVELVGRDEPAP